MKADKKWSDLGWKHPLWDLFRYFLTLRGTKAPSAFRQSLECNGVAVVGCDIVMPVPAEVCQLFEEYLEHRNGQFNRAASCLRTEDEAVAYCTNLEVSVGKTTTQINHHQSSKAIVATVAAITKSVCSERSIPFNPDPQKRCVWCTNNNLHVSARNLDGAVPGLLNPKAIWEIKEYWGATKGGSKMSDAIYECHLVGLELRRFEERANCKVSHVAFVDGKEQWSFRASDLKRFIDLLNQGLVDHLFVGTMIETEWRPTLSQLLADSTSS